MKALWVPVSSERAFSYFRSFLLGSFFDPEVARDMYGRNVPVSELCVIKTQMKQSSYKGNDVSV
jgi:hypothetical protein